MKLSIIGAAQIVQQYHMYAINKLADVNMISVVDIKENQAKKVSDYLGCIASNSISSVEGSDCVFIATPPKPRISIIDNLPKSVKKVIIEKPAGFELGDIHTLEELERARNISILVAQTRRYFLNLQLTADLIHSGLLGKVEKISIAEGAIFSWSSNTDHLSNTNNIIDKGILQDVGSHIFDWLGMLIQKLNIKTNTFKICDINYDYSHLTNDIHVSYDGPFLVDIKISRARYLSNLIVITGTKGRLVTRSLLDDKIKVISENGSSYWINCQYSRSQYSLEGAFIQMWKDLLAINQSEIIPSLGNVRIGMSFLDQCVRKINE